MRKFILLFCICLFLLCNSTDAQNAPVSSIGNVITHEATITVPVSASAVSDIASCALQINYDPKIAIAVSVTNGSILPGSMNFNISTPGIIIIGWYIWPGISLPDSAVIFNIEFSRISYGRTEISWLDDGYSCYYSNSSSVVLSDVPQSEFYHDGSLTLQQIAPVTILPQVRAGAGTPIEIPIKVTGFSGVGKINLEFEFNASVLTFQSGLANPLFGDMIIAENIPGIISITAIVDTISQGISLLDSSILCSINFLLSGVSSGLNWRNGYCKYSGAYPYIPMYDLPFTNHYINGSALPALGIADSDCESSISFYPNPCNGRGILSISTERNTSADISVYDCIGRKHFYQSGIINGKEIIPLNNLSAGINLVTIVTNNGLKVIKILSQN